MNTPQIRFSNLIGNEGNKYRAHCYKGGSLNSQIRVEAIPFDSTSRNQPLIRGPLLSIVFVYPLIDMLFLAI